MIAHAAIGVRDYEKAKEWYKKALAPLGYIMNMDHPEWKAGGYNDGKNTDFWINASGDFAKGHVAFEAKDKEQVQAFYDAALAAGGTDNGGPGFRKEYWTGYYAAFVLDLDGNNVEAVYFDYAEK
jgi:catechol 2,3-dioxygenase-like lactoylglutathione lyase family enzyme